MRYPTVVAVAAFLILAGCSSTPASSQSTPPASSTALTTADPDLADDVEEYVDEPLLPLLATWDEDAEQLALSRATGFVKTYLRPDLDNLTWFPAISGFLSPFARDSYAWIDVDNIPAATITADASVTGEPTGTRVTVAVPTDAGIFTVTLVRGFEGDMWEVSHLELDTL